MSELNHLLTFAAPETISIWADKRPASEVHLNWIVGYAPVSDPHPNGRIVYGTIHGASEEGVADVTVASTMLYADEDEPGESFPEILRSSHALEALWDTARIAFGAVSGTMGLAIELPRKAPEPELSELKRVQDMEEDDAALDVVD